MRFAFPGLVVLLCISPIAAQRVDKHPPEALLPAGCIAFARYDGYEPHKKAYDGTALAKVMNDDLGEMFDHFLDVLDVQFAETSPKWKKGKGILQTALAGYWKHGLAVGLEVGDGDFEKWRLTIVLPQGINPPYRDAVLQAFKSLDKKADADGEEPREFKERKVRERSVYESTDKQGVTLAWWFESPHAVITIGTLPPDDVIDIADGKKPNLTAGANFRLTTNFKGYESDVRGFVDLAKLVELQCTPSKSTPSWEWLAQSLASRAMSNRIGTRGLGTMTLHLGFDGKYQRSTIKVHVVQPAKRLGILKLPGAGLPWTGKFEGPPMPPDAASVALRHVEWPRVVAELTSLAELAEFMNLTNGLRENGMRRFVFPGIWDLRDLLPKDARDDALPPIFPDFGRNLFGSLSSEFTKSLTKEIAAALDTTYLSYDSPAEGPFSLGSTWAIKIKDAKKLDLALERLRAKLEEPGQLKPWKVAKSKYRGVDLVTLSAPVLFLAPTYAIHDGWWIVGLVPQPVKGFLWRGEPGRRKWSPPDDLAELYAKSRANGPAAAKLGSVSIEDPRPTISFLFSLAPFAIAAAERNSPVKFDVAKLPHAQAVTEHLFPNVSFFFDDGDALRWESHFSIDLSWSWGPLFYGPTFAGMLPF